MCVLVKGLAAAPGATVTRDLCILNGELVVIGKFFPRDNPVGKGEYRMGWCNKGTECAHTHLLRANIIIFFCPSTVITLE